MFLQSTASLPQNQTSLAKETRDHCDPLYVMVVASDKDAVLSVSARVVQNKRHAHTKVIRRTECRNYTAVCVFHVDTQHNTDAIVNSVLLP